MTLYFVSRVCIFINLSLSTYKRILSSFFFQDYVMQWNDKAMMTSNDSYKELSLQSNEHH